MTVEEQLRALCEHMERAQVPVTLDDVVVEVLRPPRDHGRGHGQHRRGLAVALAVAAAALLAGAGYALLHDGTRDRFVPADTTSTVDGSAIPSATFVSPRNGYSVEYPAGAGSSVTPAVQLWAMSRNPDAAFDVLDTGGDAVFRVASGSLSLASRDAYLSELRVLPADCDVPGTGTEEISIDGAPAHVLECAKHVEATVVAGGRLYLFTLTHDRPDARELFDAFLSTVDLTPESSVEFPGPQDTFVSPTYGYSFALFRGEAELATLPWDGPIAAADFHARVDKVETGMGAIFEGASRVIPDGVSVDDWVDRNVSPGGCEVPRREQEAIVIDGVTARLIECPLSPGETSEIDATVSVGGRLYLFILVHGDRDDARAWFDAWIETIDLTPDTATAR